MLNYVLIEIEVLDDWWWTGADEFEQMVIVRSFATVSTQTVLHESHFSLSSYMTEVTASTAQSCSNQLYNLLSKLCPCVTFQRW